MDESSVKESRVILRQIQDQLLAAQTLAGVTQESAGMVDVVYHPTNPLPHLNYVLPRRNTAWVPTGTIEQGLLRLRELDRQAVFQYIEGLFPPQFAETLKKISLEPESNRPVFAFKRGGIGGAPDALPTAQPGAGLRIRRVGARRGAQVWRLVQTDGGPIPTDNDVRSSYDLVAYRQGVPLAVLRVKIHPQTEVAQLVALAIRDDDDTLVRTLLAAGARSALDDGGALVFATPESPVVAAALAALHFVEIGRLVRYTLARSTSEERPDGRMAQSLLAGR